jgi:hypothetical protein
MKTIYKHGDPVRVIGTKTAWKGHTGWVSKDHAPTEIVSVVIDGLAIGFGKDEIEPFMDNPPKIIPINRFCRCRKGRNDGAFTNGEVYRVNHLYQDVAGDFMVEAIDNLGLTVQARANRFNIAMP